ncbi:Ankyrin repeat and BTB/POZ domain-containing protein 2 [Parelaphostrongylus tenuis]|uniref:Ankyrin repeat and BTB/POZ domain-containing protein 2 n=1 Tax=Parelaphostrongylus tenuis TaxID=148309 RepID=A0AAD5M980_PARTN|nr:Ankyrin repeat and BTB/POZ domain-containing protein 2 [Parelaphostrongylus tenuis]
MDLSLADARNEFAVCLVASGSSTHVHKAAALLSGNWTATNQFGLSLVSEAVLRSDTEALRSLIEVGFAVNVPVPSSSKDQRPLLLSEYAGWTPLTWAVATRNSLCIEILLQSKAQVDNDEMIKETPIQVAAQVGDENVVRQLLSFNANAFRSTSEYRSDEASPLSDGSPSALAAACARGYSSIVDIFIDRR